MAKPSLTIVRRMKASPERVFAALTRPEIMVQWWGPDPTPPQHAENDLRVGGKWRVLFSTKDGENHETHGVYREIVTNRRLVFTFQWITFPERETLVTVDLTPTADGTELTFLHEHFFDELVRDGHMEGWHGTLDRMQALLESAPSPTPA